MFGKFKRWLVGTPLESSREQHERLSIPIGLAVFASDALSSTAYATEEILIAFMPTVYALQANLLSLPVALSIITLMAIVVMSYRQVIRTYPEGGGTYEVSKEKLGVLPSQIAGAALLIDYVLTVAVSVSAGVAAISSTGLLPEHMRVFTAVLLVSLIMVVNLRGVQESGRVLAFPAYIFIGSMILLVGTGLVQVVLGHVPPHAVVIPAGTPDAMNDLFTLSLFMVMMKAFSHGCAALTGIEAIADGVKAFKEPADVNANKTLVLMGCILAAIFIGITTLAFAYGVTPQAHGHETIVSQVARAVFGGGSPLYYLIQGITTLILVLAANTSFSGFPRLATILASDGFLPRQLMSLGDRLVFSNGIIILGVLSILLIWEYNADTHALIPLYAIGVFLSFTLSQAGMVKHHLDENSPKRELFINALGAVVTGVVTVILALEKFTEGAWIVLLAIPILITMFRRIQAHYVSVGKQLALPAQPIPIDEVHINDELEMVDQAAPDGYCPTAMDHHVVVLVSSLHRGTIPALVYGKTIGDQVEALHIELNTRATESLKQQWERWSCGIPLVVLKSPYRSLNQPIIDYVTEMTERTDRNIVTVIVPEFVTKQSWHNLLHNQTSILIKALLRNKPGIVVTTVRYHLEE
ncbi:MAG: APC family permease [Candidatus Melainabacteria bacterium]